MNSLIKKTGIYFAGNIASKVISALIIPIYALYVNTVSLGNYDLLITLSSILSPLEFCAMWEGILKFTLGAADEDRDSCVATAIRISIPVALIISIIQVIAFGAISENWELSCLLALMTFVSGISTSWQYGSRAFGKTHDYVVSGLLGSAVNFIFIILLVCLINWQLYGLVFAYISGQLIITIFIEQKIGILKLAISHKINGAILRQLYGYCIPCVFNLLSIHLITGIGRIVISYNLGIEANGQYAFAMKFASLITAIGNIFSMAVIEEGIIREKRGILKEFYNQLMTPLILLIISLAIISIPSILIFYFFIGSTEYWESFALVPVLVSYAVLSVLSTVFGSGFMSLGRTSWNMLTTFFGLILCFPLSVILVRQVGILGAAFGLAIGSFAMMIIRAIKSVKMISYHIKCFEIIILSCAYFIICFSAVRIQLGFGTIFDTITLFSLTILSVPVAYNNAIKLTHLT